MQVYKEQDRYDIKNPVVTVGIFDGVHRGHQHILKTLAEYRDRVKGESVILTFWPHPRIFLANEQYLFKLLNTLEEKKGLLEKSGVDHLIILPFTRRISNETACEFIEEILVNKIGTRHLLVGADNQFGKDRTGDFEAIKTCSDKFGIEVNQLELKIAEEEKISSTRIRKALWNGDISLANDLLGYDFLFRGRIVTGKKIGRKMGFPTANIFSNETYKLIPKIGVYAVEVLLGDDKYGGMLNIGFRPTVNHTGEPPSVEVHIFDFDKEIYGQKATLLFKERIRNEKKFDSIDLLVQQLNRDKISAMEILKKRDRIN
ncbi:MAG: bifunctional riboflavin kinase/FAD synthetase [Bacteroidales bacterium]|nr:bifunctional riboflavin kinase/FAD synthetase [Bacteroidales bacterium]